MNYILKSPGKKVGRKYQSEKEICPFSLEPCLRATNRKSGAGYICPFTLESLDMKKKGSPGCQGLVRLPEIVTRRVSWR